MLGSADCPLFSRRGKMLPFGRECELSGISPLIESAVYFFQLVVSDPSQAGYPIASGMIVVRIAATIDGPDHCPCGDAIAAR
jgi:hypothetical protein